MSKTISHYSLPSAQRKPLKTQDTNTFRLLKSSFCFACSVILRYCAFDALFYQNRWMYWFRYAFQICNQRIWFIITPPPTTPLPLFLLLFPFKKYFLMYLCYFSFVVHLFVLSFVCYVHSRSVISHFHLMIHVSIKCFYTMFPREFSPST